MAHRARTHRDEFIRLGFEDVGGVGAGQAFVEGLFDRAAHAGAGLGGLYPVGREDRSYFHEQLARDLLHLVALGGRQVGTGAGEQIEHDQLLLAQLFAHVARFFVGQHVTQRQELLKQLLDLGATRVVGLNQSFELFAEVHAGFIDGDQTIELRADRRLQAF